LHVFGNGLGSNDWGALNASGPWYRFGLLLWLMSPFTASMALLGAFAWAKRFEPAQAFSGLMPGARTRAGLALLLTLGFAGASAFGPNLQYLRIMAPANPSNCLLAAFGVRYLVTASEDWLRGKAYPWLLASLPVVFVLASFRDYALYRDVVVRSGMQDLTVPWLLAGIERREAHALAASAAAAPAAARGVAAETASDHLGRSLQHCRREEFAECVSAAQAALRLDPKLAEAWNNAAIGYAGLQLWDDAAHSALQAVRLRPDFQLAKNNLAWVTEEKAKRTAALEP
jgi:tetratricopeptide (TPR) repeat protein